MIQKVNITTHAVETTSRQLDHALTLPEGISDLRILLQTTGHAIRTTHHLRNLALTEQNPDYASTIHVLVNCHQESTDLAT